MPEYNDRFNCLIIRYQNIMIVLLNMMFLNLFSEKESDAISCVKKDKKSQEKLIQQIKIERILKQSSLLTKQKEKQSNRQKKKRNRKKNKEI